MLAMEALGALLIGAAAALLWLAWPNNGQKTAFLKGDLKEFSYALVTLFLFAGGVGCVILGFTQGV